MRRSFIAAISLTFVAAAGCDAKVVPSDNQLIENFTLHKPEYERVLHEILRDGYYKVDVRPEEKIYYFPSSLGPPRKEIYVDVLRVILGVGLIDRYTREHSGRDETVEVLFRNFTDGFVFGGRSKGTACVLGDKDLTVVNVLDEYDTGRPNAEKVKSGQRIYRHIEGCWYLFYEYDD